MKCSLARSISRREFLATSSAAIAAVSCASALPAAQNASPIVVFSKIYQELHLSFEEATELTSAAGLDGVDIPVRPGGEIVPEHAVEELPVYAAALQKRNLQVPLITTAITSAVSPYAEPLLRTAKGLGVQNYRLGFITRENGPSLPRQLDQIRAGLKDLARLNQLIGIGAIFQNHSSSGKSSYLGGDLHELHEIVKDFDPAQIGVAFDIGHALVVHGDDWKPLFEKLKPHIKIVYVKDVKRGGRWVPFGEGDIGRVGYFQLLRKMNYRAPISLHIEYDWTGPEKQKTRSALTRALQESAHALRGWLAMA
jgi:sugar phosphate isomerase/epimerase